MRRVVLLVFVCCLSAGVAGPPVVAPAVTAAQFEDRDAGLRELPPGSEAAPDTTEARSDTPALILLTLVLLAALAALALWGATRLTGAEPRWLTATRHSFAEAGWRASGTWADFRDWLRPRA